MVQEKILITVKTYPVISSQYVELSCTAGMREDGSWIRLYPIRFRLLEEKNRFKKYQWIELNIEKNIKDFRPESYRPLDVNEIKILGEVNTANNWDERKKIILGKEKTYTNLTKLIEDAQDSSKQSLSRQRYLTS